MLSFSGKCMANQKKKSISEVCLMQPHMYGGAPAVSCSPAQQDGVYAQLRAAERRPASRPQQPLSLSSSHAAMVHGWALPSAVCPAEQ